MIDVGEQHAQRAVVLVRLLDRRRGSPGRKHLRLAIPSGRCCWPWSSSTAPSISCVEETSSLSSVRASCILRSRRGCASRPAARRARRGRRGRCRVLQAIAELAGVVRQAADLAEQVVDGDLDMRWQVSSSMRATAMPKKRRPARQAALAERLAAIRDHPQLWRLRSGIAPREAGVPDQVVVRARRDLQNRSIAAATPRRRTGAAARWVDVHQLLFAITGAGVSSGTLVSGALTTCGGNLSISCSSAAPTGCGAKAAALASPA